MSDAESLVELIALYRGDRTYQELDRDSVSPDGRCGESSWHQYARRTRPMSRSPEKATLQGIATALGVTKQRVWAAVGVEVGIQPDEDSRLIRLLSTMPTSQLSGKHVGLIVQIVDTLTEADIAASHAPPVRALKTAPSARPARAARKSTGNEKR